MSNDFSSLATCHTSLPQDCGVISSTSRCERDGPGANPGFLTNFKKENARRRSNEIGAPAVRDQCSLGATLLRVSPDAPAQRSQSRYLDRDSFVARFCCRSDRKKIQAKVIHRCDGKPLAWPLVVGMTSNGFSLADPNDRGMLDVVGFDTTVPAVIADFVRN